MMMSASKEHIIPGPALTKLVFVATTLVVLTSCAISARYSSAAASIDHPPANNNYDSSSPPPSTTDDRTYFPESRLVLDMAILSNAVYHLRNKVQSCDDAQARNATLMNVVQDAIMADDGAGADAGDNNNNNNDNTEPPRDIYQLLLPKGATCLYYSHDYSLGTQVLIVRSSLHDYVAVAYAGTDDWKTALTDGDILTSDFGPTTTDPVAAAVDNNNPTRGDGGDGDGVGDDIIGSLFRNVPDGVRVHRGFNSAVFDNNDGFRAVMNCVSEARLGGSCDGTTTIGTGIDDVDTPPPTTPYPLFTTGHSLGAADSVLLGAALHLAYPEETIRSINFGCPKVGNTEWSFWMDSLQQQDGVGGQTSPLDADSERVVGSFTIFRFVNKIDLVPRLPELFFSHAGHTLQMSVGGDIKAYYDHLGNDELGYAGVPFGWEAASYALLPVALASHPSKHYVDYLTYYQPTRPNVTSGGDMSNSVSALYYVHDFERVDNGTQVVSLYA